MTSDLLRENPHQARPYIYLIAAGKTSHLIETFGALRGVGASGEQRNEPDV